MISDEEFFSTSLSDEEFFSTSLSDKEFFSTSLSDKELTPKEVTPVDRFHKFQSEKPPSIDTLPRTIGVLSATCLGYSITNGFQVISNHRVEGEHLKRDVQRLQIDRLFVVDSDFVLPFEHARVIYLQHLENFPPCIMCGEEKCHRWRVIACGLQRLVQYRTHLIPH
ncbi:hypothetical protein TNIN_3481 [Trichonephila inaurata madagascariensis]|uniref:Uncharacterized protein n=1 Tax=Trichonephila inaurata madagascariensis TaxID=2747483 RepID=A0A8X7BPQ1_9ARAC|nr:hypothetical protein TNIN_3481 [Trichonephila inaurata madagascariensis]